ncbi:hypothetical protein PanWU01x14_267290, partial [Parasponia andersonii]
MKHGKAHNLTTTKKEKRKNLYEFVEEMKRAGARQQRNTMKINNAYTASYSYAFIIEISPNYVITSDSHVLYHHQDFPFRFLCFFHLSWEFNLEIEILLHMLYGFFLE